MKALIIVLPLLMLTARGHAQNEATFTPPQAYPRERYEAMWEKNPFTLKTAPAVVETVSMAKDLAVGSHWGKADSPTVVVVNTKTHERITLKKGVMNKGLTLKAVTFGNSRKDMSAEVTIGSETATLTYDNDYIAQVAASPGAQPGGAAKGLAPTPAGFPPGMNQGQMQRPMGMPAGVRLPTAPGAMARPTAQVAPANVSRGIPMGGGMAMGAMAPATATTPATSGAPVSTTPASSANSNVSTGGGTQVQPPAGSPLVSQNNSVGTPVPPRRRMISPATEQVQ